MTRRFGARLKGGIDEQSYEQVKAFLSSHARGRVTYAYFDGKFTVYFDEEDDLLRLDRHYPGIVATTEEIY